MLYGNKIKLRYYESKDFDLVYKLRNIPESYDWFYEYEPINSAMTKNWWEQSFSKKDEKNFIIADVKTDEAIGTCSLVHIDYRNRKCEFGRFIINPEHNSPKAAVEAEFLILEYAFAHLGLNKVYIEVLDNNSKVISLHKKFGFVDEAFFKEHIFKNNQFVDVVGMALFNKVFVENKSKFDKIVYK